MADTGQMNGSTGQMLAETEEKLGRYRTDG
jgi:hypothetical protein